SSSRKVLVERCLSRISVSLCWTKGCLTTVTPSMNHSLYPSPIRRVISEHGAVADDSNRRSAVRTQLLGKLSARGPGSPLQNLRERKRLGSKLELLSYLFRQNVEQCDRQCTPFHDEDR